MPQIRFAAAISALAAAALLAGCASGPAPVDPTESSPAPSTAPLTELELYPDPTNVQGPASAVLPDVAIDPVEPAAQPALPVTVTSYDRDGARQVEVTDVSRILAIDIAGSIAATVWGLGLGDHLVGRDTSTTFPGTEDLPLATVSGHSVSAEAVISMRPTIVLTDGTIGPRDVLEQLRQTGITVVFLKDEASFDGAVQLARDVATALGDPEAGERLAERLQSELDAVLADIAAIVPEDEALRPRIIFLYLRGGAGIYYLFGTGSGADQLINALGGIDVASEMGWVGERPMTDEALIAADPDVILVMSDGLKSTGGIDALIAAKPALGLTHAGENHRFVDMADGAVLGFGPRAAHVLEALARAIYTVPEN